MLSGQTFFDQPVKINLRAYDSLRVVATGPVDDCTTNYLSD